ncbi:hypothetical protein F4781DRAFT_418104 [Annulohypoxylon bovei var. microspora]|nr:hypothetical protein F4781DRAFT_418104 [Annulohypoxylon bovei var. microspora]
MGDTSRTGSQSLPDEKQYYPDQADAVSVVTSTQTDEVPPDHHTKMPKSMTTTATPYRPFPSLMKAYYQWSLLGIKVFNLCGPSGEHERLFAVEQHTGYSFSGPLGIRPGMILYNGTSTKDRILAAAGDESQMGARPYAFNPNTIILLPPRVPGSKFMVREMMRARSIGNGVTFQFSLDVGLGEKTGRETFEWRKIMKAEKDEEAKQGGFKLFRVPSSSSSGSSSQAVPSSSSSAVAADSNSEVFALFAWTKTFSNPNHPFTLELKVDGLATGLGESWTLAVVITAARLWMLHMCGKTNRPVVAASDRIRRK